MIGTRVRVRLRFSDGRSSWRPRGRCPVVSGRLVAEREASPGFPVYVMELDVPQEFELPAWDHPHGSSRPMREVNPVNRLILHSVHAILGAPVAQIADRLAANRTVYVAAYAYPESVVAAAELPAFDWSLCVEVGSGPLRRESRRSQLLFWLGL